MYGNLERGVDDISLRNHLSMLMQYDGPLLKNVVSLYFESFVDLESISTLKMMRIGISLRFLVTSKIMLTYKRKFIIKLLGETYIFFTNAKLLNTKCIRNFFS